MGLHLALSACKESKGKASVSVMQSSEESGEHQKARVSCLFVGDVMMHMPQIRASYLPSTSSYDFSPVFRLISPILRQADVAVANLECTFGGKPYSGYPCFSAPDEVATALRDAGFDILTTANNHTADRGSTGVLRTLDILDSVGLFHTGSFRDAADRDVRSPLFIERNGIRIALIACTYGLNGNVIRPPVEVNLIDSARIGYDIDRAIRQGADFVIASMHWGIEYQTKPGEAQTNLATWLLHRGVDVVMGSHPHVVQPIYAKTQLRSDHSLADTIALVAYSMGNFVSNQQDFPTGMGMSVGFTLERDVSGKKRIVNICAIPTYVSRRAKDHRARYLVVPMRARDIEQADLSPPDLRLLDRYRTKMLQYMHIRQW